MSKSKRLIFFGTEDFSHSALHNLIASGYNVVAVVTKPDAPAGRGQHISTPKVKQLVQIAKTEAKKLNIKLDIKIFQPARLSNIKKDIVKLKPDAGILVAYGKIIPKSLIDLFPDGIINVHPSLLPKYRGPSPIEAAILNGDKYTGITLIKLTAGMDEGPVYAQQKVEIPKEIDRLLFSTYLAAHGASFLLEKLPSILDGSLQPKPQDNSKATYTKLLTKKDGYITWKESADLIERKVRAYAGFPKARAKIFNHEVVINRVRLASNQGDGGLVIECRRGYLEILELIAPSGRIINGYDFLHGYKK